MKKSLKARNNNIANTQRQIEILSNGIFKNGELPTFAEKISETKQFPLRPKKTRSFANQFGLYVQSGL